MVFPLYSALVQACAQFWCLLVKKDVDKLGRGQRRATKMTEGLETCLVVTDLRSSIYLT